MAAVPAVAIERLRKLEQKVDGWRAQYADLQDGFQHARGEVSRLESQLQNAAYASGRRLEVDDQGRVFYREQRGGGGVRRTVGYVTRTDQPDGPHETVRYVDDAALAATGRSIARLRAEVADLASAVTSWPRRSPRSPRSPRLPPRADEPRLAGGRVPDPVPGNHVERAGGRLMANVLRKMFGGIDDAANELVRIREQVEQTRAAIAAETARPVPLAEIEARLDATITGLRAQAERLVQAGELAQAEGGPLVALLTNAQVLALRPRRRRRTRPVERWLREQALAAADKMGAPVDAPTRASASPSCRPSSTSLERDEAELLWQADERGLELPWRPDADPAAVLGLDAA